MTDAPAEEFLELDGGRVHLLPMSQGADVAAECPHLCGQPRRIHRAPRVIGFRLEGGTGAGLHRAAVRLARLI